LFSEEAVSQTPAAYSRIQSAKFSQFHDRFTLTQSGCFELGSNCPHLVVVNRLRDSFLYPRFENLRLIRLEVCNALTGLDQEFIFLAPLWFPDGPERFSEQEIESRVRPQRFQGLKERRR
jgi:hypothetical protein